MKAENKSILQKPVFWVAIVGVAIAGYVLTEPDNKASATGKTKPATKKTRTAGKASKNTIVFTEQDEKAKFQTISAPLKNSFVPVVARSGIGGADASANALPTDFTGGEANWVFTGSVEVNGVRQALLENRNTGEGVFLRRGERWKAATVQSIQENGIVMNGPSGIKTFGLVDEAPLRMARGGSSTVPGQGGFSPMQVDQGSLRGNIGGRGGFPNGFSSGLPMVVPSGGSVQMGGPAPGGDGVVIIGE